MRDLDLVVIGSSPAAISLALDALDAGLERVAVVQDGPSTVPIPESHPGLEVLVGKGAPHAEGDRVEVEVDGATLRASAAVLFDSNPGVAAPPLEAPPGVADRFHLGKPPYPAWGNHILVVGGSEEAAELALAISEQGANVVLARGNVSPSRLSRLTRSAVWLREAERRLTVLWHSRPASVTEVSGEPLVIFDDTGTPDLVFDQIVLVDDFTTREPEVSGRIWRVDDSPGVVWDRLRAEVFPRIQPDPVPVAAATETEQRIEELRLAHYNATITHFHRTHSDLWLIRVKPDHGDVSFRPGQYASLGLGYWEPRVDSARDPDLDRKWEKLVRRSYSISSPVFDEDGYLADPASTAELEFYIVLVPASGDHVPGLTPRLALKKVGDRIYLGPRIVGRYTLTPVRDPGATVVLFSTGTGEAPHNAMIAELLRKGHHGPIVSAVCVRYRADLAYLDVHRRLEERFDNYHYVPLVTREPDTEKLYIQDLIRRDLLAERHGVQLEPETTHVFLCGNPAMIGIPEWEDDQPRFPEPTGACQLLHELGFDLDRHGHTGNVHTEKYW